MIKPSHIGSLSILTLTAVFAYSGCATVDTDGEDPSADDMAEVDAEEELGEAQDELVYSCSNVSNTKWDDAWETLESQVRTKVNEARSVGRNCTKANGTKVWFPKAPALTHNTKLRCAARSHSKDLLEHDMPASHVGSDGHEVEQRVTDAGYTWKLVGEDIATSQNATTIVNNWLSSKNGHCEVLMGAGYTQFGIGYYYKSPTPTASPARATMVVAKPVTNDPCPHDKCTIGTKLASSCNTCVSQICAADPYCCNTYWDQSCVNKVSSVCNQTCN
ncbi:MAG: CAP domain-containing protein [Polyangiaceae bacterium]